MEYDAADVGRRDPHHLFDRGPAICRDLCNRRAQEGRSLRRRIRSLRAARSPMSARELEREESVMKPTRRDFSKLASAAFPIASLIPSRALAAPNSKFVGVQIGTITYSFKGDVKTPDDIIPDLVKIGLSSE